MSENSMITRPMQQDEQAAVRNMMVRSFDRITSLFFSFGDHVILAEYNNSIVGAIVLEVFSVPGRGTGGLVSWVFTSPEARGLGTARTLVTEAMRWFDDHGCTTVFACIEGHNTSSANMFAGLGFEVMTPSAQLNRYGPGIFRVWKNTSHLFDLGHFLWYRDTARDPNSTEAEDSARAPHQDTAQDDTSSGLPVQTASGVSAWWVNLAVNLCIGALFVLRTGWFTSFNSVLFLWTGMAICLVTGLRSVAMKTASVVLRFPVRYQPWETFHVLSGLIAVVFGGMLPVPGSFYPVKNTWRYKENLPQLGWMATAGTLAVLLPGAILLMITHYALPGIEEFAASGHTIPGTAFFSPVFSGSAIAAGMNTIFTIVRVFLIFELLLPFFPFGCFNGRRILDWKPAVWVFLALATVLLWVVPVITTPISGV
jgi:GNAT superfamily N-acetyltransferase